LSALVWLPVKLGVLQRSYPGSQKGEKAQKVLKTPKAFGSADANF